MPYCTIKEAWGNQTNNNNNNAMVNSHLFKKQNNKNMNVNNNMKHQYLDMNYLIPDKYKNVTNLYNQNQNQNKGNGPATRISYQNVLEKPYAEKPSKYVSNYSNKLNNLNINNKPQNQQPINQVNGNNRAVNDLMSQNKQNLQYIQYLEERIEKLEQKLLDKETEIAANNNKNSFYDIFIYIFSGIFILFILDLVLRLGKYLGKKQLKTFPSAPSFSPKIATNPLQLGGYSRF